MASMTLYTVMIPSFISPGQTSLVSSSVAYLVVLHSSTVSHKQITAFWHWIHHPPSSTLHLLYFASQWTALPFIWMFGWENWESLLDPLSFSQLIELIRTGAHLLLMLESTYTSPPTAGFITQVISSCPDFHRRKMPPVLPFYLFFTHQPEWSFCCRYTTKSQVLLKIFFCHHF